MLKKKVVPLLMILVMLLLTTNSFAQGNGVSHYEMQKEKLISTIDILEEMDNAINGIIDQSVPENILDNIDFGVNITPGKIVYDNLDTINPNNNFNMSHTVKKIGDIVYENDNIGTMYSLTVLATQKESSNEESEAGIVSYITLIWIDNLGTKNELIGVYGGWTPNSKILSDRQVHWGVDGNWSGSGYPSRNTFYYTTSKTGLHFSANTVVTVEDYPYSVFCSVQTSIFD